MPPCRYTEIMLTALFDIIYVSIKKVFVCEFFAALFFNNAVRNEYRPVAQGLRAPHIVSNRDHCIAAPVVQFVQDLYEIA